jgi:flagellar basal-body rod protein FlgC
MNSVSSIAMSGMLAAERRLEVSAHNIANIGTAQDGMQGDAGSAFRALRADQVETPGGGTVVNVSMLPDNTQMDFATEAVQLLVARYTFAANVEVMRSSAQLQRVLIDTFA